MLIRSEFKEFLESLNSAKVEYLVIGAYALAVHGIPRYTGDIDIFVRLSRENAERIEQAIDAFGLGGLGAPQRSLRRRISSLDLALPGSNRHRNWD